jgi:hypothetical protein
MFQYTVETVVVEINVSLLINNQLNRTTEADPALIS